MATYQATAFFECRGYGWTETYYRDSNAITDLAALADFDRDNIWVQRQACLNKQAAIVAQRVSFVGVKNDSVLNYIRMVGPSTFRGEDPNTALLIRLGNLDNTRRKNVFFRGVPDDVVIDGGEVANLPAWANKLGVFLDALIQNNYGWLGISTKTEIDVVDYTTTPENKVKVTLAAAPALGVAPPNKVVLRGKDMGVGKPSVLNAALPYIVTGATEVTTVKPIAVFPFPGVGGKLVKTDKELILIKNHREQKIDTRRAGKVSNLQAGRARVKPRG